MEKKTIGISSLISLGIMFLLLLPVVYSASLTNSNITSTGLSTNISVTGTIYFDVLKVENDSIYFERLRSSDGASNTITFNLTHASQSYLNAPSITHPDSETWIVNNPYNSVGDTTFELYVYSCNTNPPIVLEYESSDIGYSCSGTTLTATVTMAAGFSTFATNTVQSTSNELVTQLKSIIPWIGILLVVALASIILLIFLGDITLEDGMKMIIALLLAVIAISVILIVSILILTELGNV